MSDFKTGRQGEGDAWKNQHRIFCLRRNRKSLQVQRAPSELVLRRGRQGGAGERPIDRKRRTQRASAGSWRRIYRYTRSSGDLQIWGGERLSERGSERRRENRGNSGLAWRAVWKEILTEMTSDLWWENSRDVRGEEREVRIEGGEKTYF